MPNTVDPSIRDLNDCNGCTGIEPLTPIKLDNRPGLNQISYRVGTHQRFFQSMLSRLSDARYPALKSLNLRDTSDLTIAFLDACSAADDVLTFYTERYAQEWYVRTASERVSLVQLARLIGYEPRPGVAATVYLAFTIETTPGTPEFTTIDAGTRVMSIPGKDELPQIFETSKSFTARAIWNEMKIRSRAPQVISTDMTQLVLEGVDGSFRKGDSVLIVDSISNKKVKRIQRIETDTVEGKTNLNLSDVPQPYFIWNIYTPVIFASIPSVSTLEDNNLSDNSFDTVFAGNKLIGSDFSALSSIYSWPMRDLYYVANFSLLPLSIFISQENVFAFRQRAAIFGHNAPEWATLPQIVAGRQLIGRRMTPRHKIRAQYPDDWDDASVIADTPNSRTIDLDNVYSNIVEGSWIILESPNVAAKAFKVEKYVELTRSDYTLSVKVSRLTLTEEVPAGFKMRETTVLAVSEPLKLAPVPAVSSKEIDKENISEIVLDKFYPGIEKGQFVIVSGIRTDLSGVPGSEVCQLAEVEVDGSLEKGRLFTRLNFTTPLSFRYQPETVRINANVAVATHGESKGEVLGSGDGAKRFRMFDLKHNPLTYVSAETPSGAQSTLEIRVENVKWNEVSSLYGLNPDDPAYVIRHEDDGKVRVQFNAPLPTGSENIVASYRIGIGQPGMLKADQLSLLATKPLGVRAVTNPLPPSGAENRESIKDLRDNSPLTVLTLERLVSVKDYEDFARAFAGFSKAQAIATGTNSSRGVFITVASEAGEIKESDQAFKNLVSAIKRNGDPFVGVVMKPYRLALFQIEGTLGINPNYLEKDILASVETELRNTFGFEAREFGRSVMRTEVIAVIQKIPGVVYVNLTAWKREPMIGGLVKDDRLDAEPARVDTSTESLGAELLILDPRPLALNIIKVQGN